MSPLVNPLDLDALTLDSGSHEPGDPTTGAKVCVMEAVAYIAGEPWSDTPDCASTVIGAFLRSWNDSLNEADRNRLLKPLIPRLVGTRTTDADETTRAWLATDWLVRVQAPAWLDLAGLTDRASELRALPPLTSSEIAVAVQSVLEHARVDATAARNAARDAAWAAAWAAAGDAARDAAWAKLRSTVETLQVSALDLVERMIAVGRPDA